MIKLLIDQFLGDLLIMFGAVFLLDLKGPGCFFLGLVFARTCFVVPAFAASDYFGIISSLYTMLM